MESSTYRSIGASPPSSVAGQRRSPARVALFLMIAAVALIALVGLTFAVSEMVQQAQSPPGLGDRVDTSFGVITVTNLRAFADAHANGQGHSGHFTGPGSIPEDKQALEVSVTLANTTDHPVAYSPDAFFLRLGPSGSLLANSEATFFRGSLFPGGVLEGQVSFLVPRGEATGALEFTDQGSTDPIVIDLGTISGAGDGHQEQHNH